MRILILSSSTGGGHDMRARSLEAWCRKLTAPEEPFEIFRYQALEDSSRVYSLGVGLYNWIQKRCPWLHHLYFNWLEVFQVSISETLLLGKARYIEKLESVKPDIVVSVHAHTNHAFRVIAQKFSSHLKFVTYCGEMDGGYGFSRHWVDPGADGFIGATPEICATAEKLKMPKEKIFYGGFLLGPRFFDDDLDATQIAARKAELNLRPDKFTLLLSTGANGALNHLPFLEVLREVGHNLQVIALCGRNKKARLAIEAWNEREKGILVRPMSHRQDMHELMQVADAVVARPGTGTTSEAILSNCPVIHNTLGGVMPQEWITVKYLRSKGLTARRLKKPVDLIHHIRILMENPEDLRYARRQISKLRPQRHPREILQYLKQQANSVESTPSCIDA